MDALESVSWASLDAEAWQEIVALLVERVDVSALNHYNLTWTEAGRSLTRVLQRV